MSSIIVVLMVTLTGGFVGVSLVGFLGWRARMRRADLDLDLD